MNFSLLFSYGPLILSGLMVTILSWILCSIISLILGIITGTLRSKIFTNKFKVILEKFLFIFRAVPFHLQILFAYFVLPDLIGYTPNAWITGIWALSICSSAYTSDIVKSGINTIPQGQWEAAKTLGYSKIQTFLYIIFPQAFYHILPLLLNESNMIIKSTAMLASIGTLELTKIATNIANRTLEPFPIYLVIGIIYIILTWGFEKFITYVTKKMDLHA